ncbi:UDP-3-O-[3-hydroxymyristoyl] glucosamine N-acyltransferase [Legionella lansingensis]|uniref:UDP-3-O-[3-hydroxymyristoyl] glucosamine N-acyltransferase n=1 Tax=Legionella lansingensis TaxID=45067 RepID=A0A0W0VVY6_9GAMM|nr:UDP-3-O-(3-hydroxymyristoyl)glucosamine N-acyltransferase [Legionella lansingensis]KTD23830.1 UDP-3-O-[3-hydroxymyristoyl] glucosamine N-acyltransferase [Legionella lansingensis]SNV46798.1 UDP-3-O-[3-hydroxymyristoyl] glucosamine N-acyltransferase [Legionella lansingensis]
MYTLAEVAHHLDGVLHGNPEQPIQGIASLSRARKTDLSYFDHPFLLEMLTKTKAGAVLLTENHIAYSPANSIVVPDPLLSMSIAATLFSAPVVSPAGIHPTAFVSPSAQLGEGVTIGANTTVEEGVVLGDGVVIGANCVLEANVFIDFKTVIQHGVHVYDGTKLGREVIVESGVILGASPFNGIKQQGRWLSGPAVGGTWISDHVHIGANSVITRGALGDTLIGSGVRIDNLVMIAHDVIIGANSAIAGCAVIGANTQLGAHCIIGGASCVAPHVHLTDDVVITGMSTVNKSLTKPGVYSSGIMVSEHRQWRRNVARFRRLDDYITRLIKLEQVKEV